MNTALVFPGMGPTPFRDIGRFLVTDPVGRELVDTADDILGYSLVDAYRTTEGDYSEPAQVAFMVTCLASAHWAVRNLDVRPDVCVGPSFGEKAALAYSGVLTPAAAIEITVLLARCMDDYFAHEHTDIVTHSFARVPADALERITAESDADGQWNDVSCYVDEGFAMLSIRESRLPWLTQRIREEGGMSMYTMRPPMHCADFAPLRDRVESEVLDRFEFADPKIPVVADQDGSVITTAAAARRMLSDGFVKPLRWPTVVESMTKLGIRTACVAGPDSLFGRVRCTRDAFEIIAANPRRALTPVQRSTVRKNRSNERKNDVGQHVRGHSPSVPTVPVA
ncbi:ACP S-malonyltransferase [Rhodococcus sp. 14-2470-1a]|uniref:ACP S-malonyltransferase n=1 Tax=Rhodococcus sp. 14-2470-1a TaxID=2023150 RepID=UPI001C52E06D|nr:MULTISPECIES: hypothetical protein [unclassified Rhodococcus (in: high G+C Gram-positive bacteria)]